VNNQLISFSILREFEIFIACGWNANLGTGYESMCYLLELNNNEFNFDEFKQLVNALALDLIFCNITMTSTFKIESLP
jgi:hypothetical protein